MQQRHARALDRGVCASAHRNADIGGGEGGRIIHAVANHRDDTSCRPQLRDHVTLSLRQDLRLYPR